MLIRDDFELSDELLMKINDYITEQASAYAAGGEIPEGISVTFSFNPIGRFVDVRFDGQHTAFLIE